jgi:hypothetical protein
MPEPADTLTRSRRWTGVRNFAEQKLLLDEARLDRRLQKPDPNTSRFAGLDANREEGT